VPKVSRIKQRTDPTGRIAPEIAPNHIHLRLFLAYPSEAPIKESKNVATMKSGFATISPKDQGMIAKGRETTKLITIAFGYLNSFFSTISSTRLSEIQLQRDKKIANDI